MCSGGRSGAHLLLLDGTTGAPRPSRSPGEGARDSPGCDPPPRPPCCRRGGMRGSAGGSGLAGDGAAAAGGVSAWLRDLQAGSGPAAPAESGRAPQAAPEGGGGSSRAPARPRGGSGRRLLGLPSSQPVTSPRPGTPALGAACRVAEPGGASGRPVGAGGCAEPSCCALLLRAPRRAGTASHCKVALSYSTS